MAMAVCRSIGFNRRRRFMIVESGQGTLEGVIDTVVNKMLFTNGIPNV
jgi:hypothetical protein